MENLTGNQKPPKSWLVESILVTLFCCLPFGLVGIINAAKVESRFYAGDIEGALRASEEAGRWRKVLFGEKAIYLILIIILAFWIVRNINFA